MLDNKNLNISSWWFICPSSLNRQIILRMIVFSFHYLNMLIKKQIKINCYKIQNIINIHTQFMSNYAECLWRESMFYVVGHLE